jgi:uncharacterized protein
MTDTAAFYSALAASNLRSMAQRALLGMLAFYRAWLSPALHSVSPSGCGCGYEPTCSRYAADAILLYGPLVGSWMALRRLLRCHPFARGGFDPVPLPGRFHPIDPIQHAAADHVPACALREPLP